MGSASELQHPVLKQSLVCMTAEPGRSLVTQWFDLETNVLLHLSIQEDLIPRIPPWSWSAPKHKVLMVLVKATDNLLVDGHVIMVHPNFKDISHQQYLEASGDWARRRFNQFTLDQDRLHGDP